MLYLSVEYTAQYSGRQRQRQQFLFIHTHNVYNIYNTYIYLAAVLIVIIIIIDRSIVFTRE